MVYMRLWVYIYFVLPVSSDILIITFIARDLIGMIGLIRMIPLDI